MGGSFLFSPLVIHLVLTTLVMNRRSLLKFLVSAPSAVALGAGYLSGWTFQKARKVKSSDWERFQRLKKQKEEAVWEDRLKVGELKLWSTDEWM